MEIRLEEAQPEAGDLWGFSQEHRPEMMVGWPRAGQGARKGRIWKIVKR